MSDWLTLSTKELHAEARRLNRDLHGDRVTYVVNRNINFTNVCSVGCTFCGFARSSREEVAYNYTPRQVVKRLARTSWVSEVCIQGGIPRGFGFENYLDIVRAVKGAFPDIHIHAFSPMEIHHMHRESGRSYRDILLELQNVGLGSIPGTAAEILVDRVRREVSGNKLTSSQWEEIVRTAHGIGLPSTATIMFGHVESWDDIFEHLDRIRNIQLDTGGFTEFVPLAFIPYRNRLGQRLAREYRDPDFRRLERMTREKAERLYPICRLFFGQLIPNLQTSWVKLGLAQAIESLEWGCNDFGGTLYEESITRASGGPHGECLEPGIIEESLRRAGKTPARRTTLYHYAESYSLADYSAPKTGPSSMTLP
jgi:7,8-didemethyl-8-hydroxy-5-deazariboflavin synthase CofH subunit